jgi:nitrite reductase (NO-forming)
MASGLEAPPVARVRAAHLTLNLLGLVGLVIAGTLPFFTATQARVKMSARATGRAQGLVLAGLVGALGASRVAVAAVFVWVLDVGARVARLVSGPARAGP